MQQQTETQTRTSRLGNGRVKVVVDHKNATVKLVERTAAGLKEMQLDGTEAYHLYSLLFHLFRS